jgi:hypothetical protein
MGPLARTSISATIFEDHPANQTNPDRHFPALGKNAFLESYSTLGVWNHLKRRSEVAEAVAVFGHVT